MKKSFYLGIFLMAVCYILSLFPESSLLEPIALRMLGVLLLMAVFWVFETIPIAATSIIPLFALPFLQIMPSSEVALAYGSNMIWLFMTGFFIGKAIEKWNLHTRIATYIISSLGFTPNRLIGGFLLATAFISVWISNTATALMMLPIAVSTIDTISSKLEKGEVKLLGTGVMLAIAYGANIGGMASPIGSPPNLIFLGVLQESFPNLPEINFLSWILIASPMVVIFLAITWFYLIKTNPISNWNFRNANLPTLHRMSTGEIIVAILFAVTVLLWMTRADINLGSVTISGWASTLNLSKYVKDSTVGALICSIMFCIPLRDSQGNKTSILDWETASSIPWGILLLFGGGIALSKGIISSGLSDVIASNIESNLAGLTIIIAIAFVCIILTFMTEVTSNTAMASLMMPVLATIAPVLEVNPALLMMPAALSTSCAFMLPVATPPNAIVYSQKYFSIATMAKTGLVLNIIGVVLITLAINFIALPVLNVA